MVRLPRRIACAVSRRWSRRWRLLRGHSVATWTVIGIAVASAVVVLVPLVLFALGTGETEARVALPISAPVLAVTRPMRRPAAWERLFANGTVAR